MDEKYISLRGPIKLEGDKLVLRVPLNAGGEEINTVASGISVVDGDDLVIIVPPWLAEKLQIVEGTEVCVDNRSGIFNINKTAE
jgi:hypothetical protein